MEETHYKWFLNELISQGSYFPMLETALCRGDVLTNWFENTPSGSLCSRPIRSISRTRQFISHSLNKRVPLVGDYFSEKFFCYIFYKQGHRLVTSKEAESLAENQFHGLQIRSVHILPPDLLFPDKVYKVLAWNEDGEIHSSLTIGPFNQETGETVKDRTAGEKALKIISLISYTCKRSIKHLYFYMVFNLEGTPIVIKITQLEFMDTAIIDKGIKILQDDDSMSISDGEIPTPRIKIEKSKSENRFLKLPNIKNQFSSNFLEMIAKTFDRQRKRIKKNPSHSEQQEYWLQSIKKYKMKTMSSLDDLLYYVEKTRPPVWMKDSPKKFNIPQITPKASTSKAFYTKLSPQKTVRVSKLKSLRPAKY